MWNGNYTLEILIFVCAGSVFCVGNVFEFRRALSSALVRPGIFYSHERVGVATAAE